MNIKGKKVLIHGEDVTSSIKSIYEVFSGYQVCYLNTAISSFSTSDVEIIDVKPFDISEHEFSCSNFKACKPSWVGDDLQVEIVDSDFTHYDAVINKQDAIAIAKALGVTAEDLL